MAGGKFVSMNKVIPGVYFALQSQAPVQSVLSPTGVLAWVAPQTWGDEIEYIGLGDYARDTCYSRIGRHNTDDRMQIFSQFCNTLICVNPAKNRVAAEATIRAPQASGIDLYIKLGIKTAKLPDPATGLGLSASVSDGKISLALTTDDADAHPIPAGYAKSLSVEELVAGNDDTYIAELYKSVSGSPIDTSGMSFTSLSGTVSEAIGSLTPSGGASWVGPSDAVGSLRCQQLMGQLKAFAQKPGSLGNSISIAVTQLADGRKEVRTTLDGIVVDRQRISSWTKFVDSAWVRLEGEKTFAPALSDAINLSGGSDGDVEPQKIVSAEFTSSAVQYHFEASDSNRDARNLSLEIAVDGSVYTLKLKRNGVQVGEDVVATGGLAHIAEFQLEDGLPLELIAYNAAGEKVADSVSLQPSAGSLALSGGNNGVVIGLGDALVRLRDEMYNVVVTDRQDVACQSAVAQFIVDLSDNQGKDRRAVICAPEAGSVAANPYDEKELTVLGQAMDNDASLTAFCVAAMSAGASWNSAITYSVLPISGDPSIVLNDQELEQWIGEGYMPISKREDGFWCITKDINSMHGDDDATPEILKKNRAVRLIQTLRNTIKYVWETQYVGKVTNDALGRDMLKGSICAILDLLVNGRGIAQYAEGDVVVMAGEKPDEVIMQLALTIYDSMEILYITMTL